MLVFFDLETTGLSDDCQIVSISAICGNCIFHAFVKPTIPIPPDSSRVHGITDDMVRDADPWTVVGVNFAKWVFMTAGKVPILCAFNGARFDFKVLLQNNLKIAVDEFPPFSEIYAVDPYPLTKKLFATDLKNFRQATVYEHLFGAQPHGQHSSLGDVEALQKIASHPKVVGVIEASAKPMAPLDGRLWFESKTKKQKREDGKKQNAK
jgi:DNA polymerase III epsilon subunit-like protein